MSAIKWNQWFHRVSVAIVFSALLGVQPAFASGPDRVCVPEVSGWGNPNLDGVVEAIGKPSNSPGVSYIAGDQGWNQAHRVNLFRDNLAGTVSGLPVTSDAFVQFLKSNYNPTSKVGTLWIAIWVDRAPAVDNTVVLGIAGSDTNPEGGWRLHITPFCETNCGMDPDKYVRLGPSPQVPENDSGKYPSVQVWHNTNDWNGGGSSVVAQSPSGSWADDSQPTKRMKVARSGNRWSLEIEVPFTTDSLLATSDNSKVYLPLASQFRLYVDVLSTNNSHIADFVVQRPWPHQQHLSGGDIRLHTPAVANWGLASLTDNFTDGFSCKAVEISNGDFGVRNNVSGNTGHQIAVIPGPYSGLNGPIVDVDGCKQLADNYNYPNTGAVDRKNTFWAKPINMSTTQAASSVNADFYVADWGISADWTQLGSLASPIPGATNTNSGSPVTLDPNGSGTSQKEVTTTWDLSYKQSCLYTLSGNIGANAHHCVQVILKSNDHLTAFSNRSAINNFDFVGLSKHERSAVLSTRNMGPVPSGETMHRMLLISRKDVFNYKPDGKTYYATAGSNGNGYVPPELRAVSADRFPGPITAGYLWAVDGFLLNGRKLIINGNQYEDTNYVSSFGYLGGHNGPVANRKESLIGPDGNELPSIADGIQVAQIPFESSITVTTRQEVKEAGTVPPPCTCQCNDVSCRLKCNLTVASGGGNLSTSLAFVGALGAGGFAFLRRRRSQKLSDLVERSKD